MRKVKKCMMNSHAHISMCNSSACTHILSTGRYLHYVFVMCVCVHVIELSFYLRSKNLGPTLDA